MSRNRLRKTGAWNERSCTARVEEVVRKCENCVRCRRCPLSDDLRNRLIQGIGGIELVIVGSDRRAVVIVGFVYLFGIEIFVGPC